jgi:hypothetical protein
MRQLVMTIVLIMAVGPCSAVEIPFRDGSVVDAVSYTVTGSYVMLEMEGGGKVAYDVADIDLASLRRAEAAAAGAPTEPAEPAKATIGNSGALLGPGEDPAESAGGLVITDQNVKHVRGSGIAGPEDEAEAPAEDAGGVPEGFEQGGNVLLNNVSVKPLEGGEWEVRGEVVNRTAEPVLDVRANLEAAVPDGAPWTASVGVSAILGPDEKASFTHTFSTPESAGEGWAPQIQVNVVWMKSEARLEPEFNRTAPHPSALPFDRGGVGGVETRGEVEL